MVECGRGRNRNPKNQAGDGELVRENVRVKILTAARSVFSTKGYRASTVSDLIREAHVARATFYKYFPNKRQVFYELLREFLDTLYENTRNYVLKETENTGELSARIRDGLALFYRYFFENRPIVQVYYREAFGTDARLYAAWDDFDRRMTALFTRVLEVGVEDGLLRPIDTNLVATALMMVFLQVPYREIMVRGAADVDVERLADEVVALVMRGILKDPGGQRSGVRE